MSSGADEPAAAATATAPVTTLAEQPPCKHIATPTCDTTCDCWCDACQAFYEKGWDTNTSAENLCWSCGMPHELTLATLKKHEYTHFYLPCPSCQPRYADLMRQHNLCSACRAPVGVDGICSECVCTETDGCKCRECRMEMVKEVTATSSGR